MWWDNLTNLQQISFIIGTASTIIMFIFIVLMLIGMDGDSFDGDVDLDMDMDFDTDIDINVDIDDMDGSSDVDIYNNDGIGSISGLRIVTIRGVLAFFSIGSWTVYLLADNVSVWVAILIGGISGAIAAVLLAIAMKAILKLESSGNLDYSTAVGKTATVYIRVRKESIGKGKVIFNHQGKMVEVDAITKDKEDILNKTEVKIIGLVDETTLVVKKI